MRRSRKTEVTLMQTPQGLSKPGGDNVTTLASAGAEGTAAKHSGERTNAGRGTEERSC